MVGRTGSGKSSLLTALFRMQPICGGAVLLDDVNVADVSVQTLRWGRTLKMDVASRQGRVDDRVYVSETRTLQGVCLSCKKPACGMY